MDSFSFEAPARARRQVGRPVVVALGVALALAAAGGLFVVTKSGGEVVAEHVKDTIAQVEPANDLQAQATLQSALASARVAFVESASFESASASQLATLDPAITFVDGATASTGPNVVSVQVAPQAWGAAALSPSGTCFWIRETVAGGTAYGSGDPCTGAAAMSATGPSF